MKDRCEDEIPLKWPARQAAGRPKKTAAPAPPLIPRITRLMALAIKFQEMIDRGEVKDYAELARLGLVTRARITQIMNLCLLAPDIQEQILFCPSLTTAGAEGPLRPLTSEASWREQRQLWRATRSSQSPPCPESLLGRQQHPAILVRDVGHYS